MSFTYTNRKGQIHFLCQGTTSTGKPKYYFALQPKGTPAEKIPDGFEVQETVNGMVSLVRTTVSPISSEDIAAVESELQAHPKSRRYRVYVKGKEITIHEQTNPGISELAARLGLPLRRAGLDELEASHAHYIPVMRFILTNETKRLFTAERWCFRGHIDGWIGLEYNKRISRLAPRLIPLLGTDEIYETF